MRSGIVSTVGPGVEPVGAVGRLDVEPAGAAAGDGLALDDGDLAAGAGQAHGGGEPGEPRADDDDVVGGSLDGAHQTVLRVAA